MKKAYPFLLALLCLLLSNYSFAQCPEVDPSVIIVNGSSNNNIPETCNFGVQFDYNKNSANNSSIQIEILINGAVAYDVCELQAIGSGGGPPDIGTVIIPFINIPCNADVQLRWTGYTNPTCGGNDCDGATLITIGGLPVELVTFDARMLSNDQVQVEWVTATEENNDYFELQYSTDGSDFQPLERIQGQGTTATAYHYSYTHKAPSTGHNYYRIKQVDYDGKSETFHIVEVTLKERVDFIVYPTQTADFVSLKTPTVFDKDIAVNIYRSTGEMVLSGILKSGEYQVSFDVNELPSGVYLIRFVNSDFDYEAKPFIKVKI